MSVDIMKTANRIHDLEVMNREIPIEGNEQKVRMCDVFQPAITGYIEDLRELNKYRKKYGKLVSENGKEHARQSDSNRSSPVPLT
jgi:hypothetical protein